MAQSEAKYLPCIALCHTGVTVDCRLNSVIRWLYAIPSRNFMCPGEFRPHIETIQPRSRFWGLGQEQSWREAVLQLEVEGTKADYKFWKQCWTQRQRLFWIWSLAMRTLQGREKQILGPPSMPGPVWAVFHFNALCVYKGETGDEFFFPSSPPCGCVRVLDSANSDLHFPCTACEMFSDVGSVTAIMYQAHSLALFLSYSYLHVDKDSLREWEWGSAAVITSRVTEMEIHT